MSTDLRQTLPKDALLGNHSAYPKKYDKSLLQPVSRELQRDAMAIPRGLKFFGQDIWNAYELYWLDEHGKPVRSYASFIVPASSKYLAESKSVKLYLNSLNHQRFRHASEVQALIASDLSAVCQEEVLVHMQPEALSDLGRDLKVDYLGLDDLPIRPTNYQRAPHLLRLSSEEEVCEKLVSHLFKSHCLCTGQPDMASIFIEYQGQKLDHSTLLSYLVSYRDHAGFSENCIEQIFVDMLERLRPNELTVFGRFTRRGGIDINPCRSTHAVDFDNLRLVYQ